MKFTIITGSEHETIHSYLDSAICWIKHLADGQDSRFRREEADTKKVQAQAEADAGIIKAEGEAKANKAKSDSITDNLIRMKEAEAREKHGWVTVNGAGSVITNKE